MNEARFAHIVTSVVDRVLSNRNLSFPWYQPDILSEADVRSDLPLLYSWNEVVTDGCLQSFSVSANGAGVAALLLPHLPRSDPDFTIARDSIMDFLTRTQNAMLVSLCAEFRSTPSRLSLSIAA